MTFKSLWWNQKFQNHNFSSDLEDLTSDDIREAFRASYDELSKPLPFLLSDIFPFTLSAHCCKSFLHKPGLPATAEPRDYYLSKLEQFLITIFAVRYPIQNSLKVEASIRTFLESISEHRAEQLGHFNWAGLYADMHRHNIDEILEKLHSYLPEPADLDAIIHSAEGHVLESTVPTTGAGADIDVACMATPEQQGAVEVRTPPPMSKESLASERRQLLEQFRKLTERTAASVYKPKVMPDRSDFYRWLRGELPPDSSMTAAIEQHLREAIASAQKP